MNWNWPKMLFFIMLFLILYMSWEFDKLKNQLAGFEDFVGLALYKGPPLKRPQGDFMIVNPVSPSNSGYGQKAYHPEQFAKDMEAAGYEVKYERKDANGKVVEREWGLK